MKNKNHTHLKNLFDFLKSQNTERLKDYSDYNDFCVKKYGGRKEELEKWLETLIEKEQKDFKFLFGK